MTLPVPGQPGETPEQRQARFAAADAVQARIDAERRAQLEAQANPVSRRLPEGVGIPMPTPQPPAGGLTQAAPFDVAAAYRQHSQKLADAIKAGQITVERARQLQAPLFAATRLGSTPEGQAAMNAAAAQAQGGMPMSGYDAAAQYRNFGQELMGMIKSGALTVEQANALKAPVFNAVKLGNSNAGYQQMQAALNAARQQMGGQNMGQSVNPVTPPQEIMVTPYQRMPEIVAPPPPMPQPPEREVIGFKTPPPGVRSGDTRIFADQPVTPPPMPSAPAQAPLFDRNASLKQLNETFGNLRNTYGEDALRSAGLTPGIFQGFQKTMRELQLNNNSTQDQHTAALQNAYNTMNSFTNNLTPRQLPAPPQGSPNALTIARGPIPLDQQGPPVGGGIGAFLGRQGEAPQAGGMLPRLAEMLNPQPRQPTGVDNTTFIAGDPNFRFGETPQVKAPNAQGMAMGGLLRKYYGGGMC